MEEQLIECIPNISEGRNLEVIQAIAEAISTVPGVYLLNVDSGESANRSVYTFAGAPNAVIEAAYQMFKCASQLIDMESHKGEHPRMGMVDVCPLVPLKNISLADLNVYAENLAEQVGKDFGVPIYLYADSARNENRYNLATIRKGEYEGMAEKMLLPEWKPDYGPIEFNPYTGVTALGVRDFLIAYNVNLNTESVQVAWEIARDVREIGRLVTDDNGKKRRLYGSRKGLKAIAWFIEEFACAQVSMNLVNLNQTGIYEAYEACRISAENRGYKVMGSELVGLVPLKEMIRAGDGFLESTGLQRTLSERELIQVAVDKLQLNSVKEFDIDERIIEYRLSRMMDGV